MGGTDLSLGKTKKQQDKQNCHAVLLPAQTLSVCGLPSYVRAKPATPELYTAISTAHLEGEYRWKTYPASKKKTAVLLPITKWDLLLILSFPTHQKGGKLCKPSR